METLRSQMETKIEILVILYSGKFFIPYPQERDVKAQSKKDWDNVDGFSTLINTINNKNPNILRRAALRYILPTLTDTQLLELYTSLLEDEN